MIEVQCKRADWCNEFLVIIRVPGRDVVHQIADGARGRLVEYTVCQLACQRLQRHLDEIDNDRERLIAEVQS